MWLNLLTHFARETGNWSGNNIPTLDEYLSFAWQSTACDIMVLTSIQFYGIKLSEEMSTCEEFTSLCEYASLVCRLLNDLNTCKREKEEGKMNSISVQTAGGVSEEAAILKAEQLVEYYKRKVLEMVYHRKGSIVPGECKQLFWKLCKLAHCLYSKSGSDEFSSPQEVAKDMKTLLWEPIELPPLSRWT